MPYALTLDKAYSKYGAEMGRREYKPDDRTVFVKLHLNRVRPYEDGDYDAGGAYWGNLTAHPLYCAEYANEADDSDLAIRLFVRAASRDLAKAELKKTLPNATFYR